MYSCNGWLTKSFSLANFVSCVPLPVVVFLPIGPTHCDRHACGMLVLAGMHYSYASGFCFGGLDRRDCFVVALVLELGFLALDLAFCA